MYILHKIETSMKYIVYIVYHLSWNDYKCIVIDNKSL